MDAVLSAKIDKKQQELQMQGNRKQVNRRRSTVIYPTGDDLEIATVPNERDDRPRHNDHYERNRKHSRVDAETETRLHRKRTTDEDDYPKHGNVFYGCR